MKRLLNCLPIVVASVMFFSIPAMSEEGTIFGGYDSGVTVQKNECLLVAKNCTADTVQERIEKLTIEINRGTEIYTKDELRKMEMQLNEYNRLLNYLDKNERNPGAGV